MSEERFHGGGRGTIAEKKGTGEDGTLDEGGHGLGAWERVKHWGMVF